MTKAKKPAKKSRFGVGLVIYAWILMSIGAAALFLLLNFVRCYEQLQPKHTIASYRSSLTEQLPQAALDALGDLDARIQSPESSLRWMQERIGAPVLVKDGAKCDQQRLVYGIQSADGIPVGSVTFRVTETGPFEIPVWSAVEEQFDFSAFYQTTQVVLPPDWPAFLGEERLGPDQIVEEGIPYALLSSCYDHYEDLPYLVRYEAGPYVGEPALRVLDPSGAAVPAEERTEERFLDNCDPTVRAQAEAFIPEFIELYVLYSADVDHNAMAYYGRVRQLAVPNSQLMQRIDQAVGSFGYTNTRALTIESIQILSVTDLGQGRYLANVGYDSQITGLYRTVTTHDDVQIVLLDTGNGLLADALYYS
ncbi:MAG: hypothetical protein IK095_02835 [Oscillospiraceae bacterium]|nr:hypothetical protein [Oscillospiraceae bacterium]